MLAIQNLRKQVGGFHLEADFHVEAGERVALVGPSGSGKTSLLRVICGLDPLNELQEGRILLGTEDQTRLPPEKRGIGVVFQDQALFSTMNVWENAAFGLQMRGVSKEKRREEAMAWLRKVSLQSRADARVSELSGGERQLLAFVRALIWKPRAVLLDEPFSALDAVLRDQVRQELLALHESWPVPMLLVTHDEQDIREIATSVLRIEGDAGGKIRRILRARSS